MVKRTQDAFEGRHHTMRLGVMVLTLAARADRMSLVPGRTTSCPGLAAVPS